MPGTLNKSLISLDERVALPFIRLIDIQQHIRSCFMIMEKYVYFSADGRTREIVFCV